MKPSEITSPGTTSTSSEAGKRSRITVKVMDGSGNEMSFASIEPNSRCFRKIASLHFRPEAQKACPQNIHVNEINCVISGCAHKLNPLCHSTCAARNEPRC
jgi:hypothetical protein